jgi:hypothetical protein
MAGLTGGTGLSQNTGLYGGNKGLYGGSSGLINSGSSPAPGAPALLLESGSYLLLEDGSKILLE